MRACGLINNANPPISRSLGRFSVHGSSSGSPSYRGEQPGSEASRWMAAPATGEQQQQQSLSTRWGEVALGRPLPPPLFAMLPRSQTKPATNNREITTTQNTHVQILHFCRTQPVLACRKFRSGLLSRKTADSNRTPLDLKINAAIVRNRWMFSPTVALFTLSFFGI